MKKITYEGSCDANVLAKQLRDLIRVGDVLEIEPSEDSVVVTVSAELSWERREMVDRAVARASGRAPMPKRRGRKT